MPGAEHFWQQRGRAPTTKTSTTPPPELRNRSCPAQSAPAYSHHHSKGGGVVAQSRALLAWEGAMLCTAHPTALCTGKCSKLAAMHAGAAQFREAGCRSWLPRKQRPLGREGPCSERRTTLYPVCPARWEVHHTGYHACAPSTNQPARRGVLLAARSSALPAGEGPCSGSCSPWTPPPPSGCTGSQLLACYPHNTLAREAGCPGRCPEQSPLAGSPEPCSGHRHRSTPSPSVPESCPAHSTSAREAGWQGGCPEQSPPGRGSYAGSYAPGQAPSITPAALCTGCAAHLLLTLLLHRSTAREAGCPGRRQKQSPPCMGGAMLCTEHPTTLCTGECSKLAAMHARATQISRGVNAGCPEQSTLAGSPLPCSGHQH